MKKISGSAQNKETERPASEKSTAGLGAAVPRAEADEPEDPMAGLQADLDRFRDLALRSQANFELGLEAAKGEGEQSPIYSGMTLVLKQLNDLLSENGLQPIEAEGKKFDPNLHEAIAHEPSEFPEETVIRQIRRGYRFRDRLLRPARVVVSSGLGK